MCGIAGYVGARQIAPETRAQTLALMGRRGPDDHGELEYVSRKGKRVYLLHTRLSIIDLDERAAQPFRRGDDALIYNGELYNYVEQRASLQAKFGEGFSTESDTEVLLSVLQREGAAGLDGCEGMWAFAFLDAEPERLLLGRDRFGEKPLYTLQDEDGLYFASEIKFLFILAGRRPPVNLNQLHRYLINGYKSLYKQRASFFEGVTEFPAACTAEIDINADRPGDGLERATPYWRPDFCNRDESLSYADAVALSREALIESVRLRLRADVPLAFCMSGGIDSNSLLSIARREFDYDVHGFTIVNSDERYEEQGLVETAVRELGIRHSSIPVQTDGFLPKLRQLVRQHDAPVYTITYYAHWLLQQAIAEQGYKISISGTAADELFSGYYDHHLFYLREISHDPQLYAEALANWKRDIQPIVRNPYLQDPERFIRDPQFRDHIFLDAEGFAAYLKSPRFEAFAEENYCEDLLRNRMLNELFHESVPVILHEDDLNAMYFSIENRSPFLDRKLFESCARIPTRHLVRDGKAKAPLRDAMCGIVPEEILESRRKVGFNAPIYAFLNPSDPETRAFLLDDGPVFEHIEHSKIEALLARDSLPNSQSKFLFYFINMRIFLEDVAQA